MQWDSSTQAKAMGGKVASLRKKAGEVNFSGERKRIWECQIDTCDTHIITLTLPARISFSTLSVSDFYCTQNFMSTRNFTENSPNVHWSMKLPSSTTEGWTIDLAWGTTKVIWLPLYFWREPRGREAGRWGIYPTRWGWSTMSTGYVQHERWRPLGRVGSWRVSILWYRKISTCRN